MGETGFYEGRTELVIEGGEELAETLRKELEILGRFREMDIPKEHSYLPENKEDLKEVVSYLIERGIYNFRIYPEGKFRAYIPLED